MCECICACVYARECACVHVCARMCACTYARVCVHARMRVYVCTHVCACMCACIFHIYFLLGEFFSVYFSFPLLIFLRIETLEVILKHALLGTHPALSFFQEPEEEAAAAKSTQKKKGKKVIVKTKPLTVGMRHGLRADMMKATAAHSEVEFADFAFRLDQNGIIRAHRCKYFIPCACV